MGEGFQGNMLPLPYVEVWRELLADELNIADAGGRTFVTSVSAPGDAFPGSAEDV